MILLPDALVPGESDRRRARGMRSGTYPAARSVAAAIGLALFDSRIGDVVRQSLGEKVQRRIPQDMRVAAVVDPSWTVHASEKSGVNEVDNRFLYGALGPKLEAGRQIGRIDQAVTLSDRCHHGEAMLLTEHNRGEFLNPRRLRVRHADMLLHESCY